MKRARKGPVILIVVFVLALAVVVLWAWRFNTANEQLELSMPESEIRMPAQVAEEVGRWMRATENEEWVKRFDNALASYTAADARWWSEYARLSHREKKLVARDRVARQRAARELVDPIDKLNGAERVARDMLEELRQ